MDFELPGEDHPQRKPMRDWFEAHPHPTGRELAQAGFAVPHWPKPWGLGADAELQLIIDQEMKRAGVHVAAQSGRHQQLRAVAADPRHRGAARALPVAGARRARRSGACCSASRRAAPTSASCARWRDATATTTSSRATRSGPRSPTRRRSACWSRAPIPTAAQAQGPVAVPGRHGHARHPRAADHRHVGARERVQRGLPRRGAHSGRPAARQGG